MGEGRGAYRASVGRPEGKRLPEKHERRWKDNIKMELQEICKEVDWMVQHMDKLRAHLNVVMSLHVS